VALRVGQSLKGRKRYLGERVRGRRNELGITEEQVVERLAQADVRITEGTLSSVERGAGIDVGMLPELAVALGCTVTYLLGLTDSPDVWEPDHPTQRARAR
jgi:transcriptional regulator with XRE-family HTH domain